VFIYVYAPKIDYRPTPSAARSVIENLFGLFFTIFMPRAFVQRELSMHVEV